MLIKILTLIYISVFFTFFNCFASSIKPAEFSGKFYPEQKEELSVMIDNFLEIADPKLPSEDIFMLISPHAGYGYSGATAAFGYKLIKNKPYQTVIILGASHHKLFNGAAVFAQGGFVTNLGKIEIDEEFTKNITGKIPEVFIDESVFSNEHSVEVQLPFLQKTLKDFKIVPVIVGDCSLESCKKIAQLFRETIGQRKDVLVIVATDLYHGYDYEQAQDTDKFTLNFIQELNYEALYYVLRDEKAQACAGLAVVVGLNLAKNLGCQKAELLKYTNSAIVTGNLVKGEWTVGYVSGAVAYPVVKSGGDMLNNLQKDKLLKIARQSIQAYLKTGKKLEVNDTDPLLNQKMGAFVTLNKHKELRGCIGNIIGTQPLYLTVRDMAVESAVADPRFPKLSLTELKEVEIEISVLSVLKKVSSADEIELGKHGVIVKKGFQSGVFLPQVATETGWSKEEFLNILCSQKAGLPEDAWKDKNTELFIFSAEVFSEKESK